MLTADCEMCICSAARVNPPSDVAVMNASSWRGVGFIERPFAAFNG
jgi:hypothetical protein